jgi:putative ABC transport system ATP-binding protein
VWALRAYRLGVVFQQFFLLESVSALDNVATGLLYRGVAGPERRRLARQALERVGLAHRLGHRPTALSGGERQRVAIARALAGRPEVVLADEPTGNLDSTTSADLVALLRALNRQGVTLVVVTHDHSVAAAMTRHAQFLVESLLLATLGGATGVAAGAAVTVAVAHQRQWTVLIPAVAVWGGLAAATIIGAVAGLYPALRAARLAPTDALRSV